MADMRQLALLVVGLNPPFILVDNAYQCLSRIDKLSCMNVLRAYGAVASGNDVAIRKVQAGKVDSPACQFYALFGT